MAAQSQGKATTIDINLQPALYADQRTAIFDKNRYVFIEASTKSGKTLGCMQWILTEAGKKGNGANYWWVAPVFRQAKIAYLRIKRGLLPYKKYGFQFRDGDLKIILPNDAIISCLSGDDSDNLYGDDVQAAVIDEASRVKEESFHAIRSTLTATNGHIRCIGNVKGKGNWFYRLSRMAQSGELKYASYYKLDAYDAAKAGVIKLEEIEDAKRTLPEQVFKELFLAEPSDDGGNPFGIDAIDSCINKDGVTSLLAICYGLDLGKSNDYTVLTGLDRNGNVCYFERWRANWDLTIAKVKEVTRGVKLLADATGLGDRIVEELKKPDPGKSYPGSNVEAFVFGARNKQQIMEGLAVAIQRKEISYPDGKIPEELRIYEYQYTRNSVIYTAPQGYHDDCVCSLALARQAFSTFNCIQVTEENFDEAFTGESSRITTAGFGLEDIDEVFGEDFGPFDPLDFDSSRQASSAIISQINDSSFWKV